MCVCVCMWISNLLSDNLIFVRPRQWYLVTLKYLHFSVATNRLKRREKKTRRVFYDITAKIVFSLWYMACQLFFILHSNIFNWNINRRLKIFDKMEHFLKTKTKKRIVISKPARNQNWSQTSATSDGQK